MRLYDTVCRLGIASVLPGVGPPSLYCIGVQTVLPHDPFTCGSVGVSPRDSCKYLVVVDDLNFFLGTSQVFLPGRLNDPCRGRRWSLVVTPHPVIKISFSFSLIPKDQIGTAIRCWPIIHQWSLER